MNMLSLIDILSTSSTITTVLQFLTGALVCRKYIQKKSTGESSGFPFICGFLSCSLWLKYGILTDEHTVILVNTIGTSLFFSYNLVYYVFTVNKKNILRQFSTACLILLSGIAYTQYEKDTTKAVEAMGYLCCTVTVIFFAAPLTMLVHVIKVKSTESLPFPLIFASFFVSLQWLVYGILIEDAFIQVPNFLGCVLSGSQLFLFLCFPNKVPFNGPAYKPLDQSAVDF